MGVDGRAVLFDFYGTLAFAPSWGPTLEEVLAGRGIRATESARARWNASVHDGQDHAEHSTSRDVYLAWERARLASFVRDCGADDCDVDQVVGDLHDALRAFTMSPYPEAADVLGDLRAMGVVVAVCS